jgi:hypothetical protein
MNFIATNLLTSDILKIIFIAGDEPGNLCLVRLFSGQTLIGTNNEYLKELLLENSQFYILEISESRLENIVRSNDYSMYGNKDHSPF